MADFSVLFLDLVFATKMHLITLSCRGQARHTESQTHYQIGRVNDPLRVSRQNLKNEMYLI